MTLYRNTQTHVISTAAGGENFSLNQKENKMTIKATKKPVTIECFKSEADRYIAHLKYKRCLAMARWCASRSVPWGLDNRWDRVAFYDKWKEKWLKLADKYKEVK